MKLYQCLLAKFLNKLCHVRVLPIRLTINVTAIVRECHKQLANNIR